VLDRPRADAGALGQVPDREEAVLAGRLLLAAPVAGQADLLDDLEDLLGAVAEVGQALDVGDPVEAGAVEQGRLPVVEPGRLEELGLGPFGEALRGQAGFAGQVFHGHDIFAHIIPMRSN
jgi:hypothetical protein